MKTNQPLVFNLQDEIYPGFDHEANKLSKFLASSDLFTILLKNGEIIHHIPTDKNAFHHWLTKHNIENIKIGS
ncbi:MAG: hypothetical protein ABI308_16075 [Mucilaginibacter sp.]